MITRKSQILSNFLNIRVIVNGKNIYTVQPGRPVLIPLSENKVTLVATDGFHISRPMHLNYHARQTYRLGIVCGLDDNIIRTGLVLLLLFFMVGLFSDLALFRALSFAPVLYFLFYYYINRKDFIRIIIAAE